MTLYESYFFLEIIKLISNDKREQMIEGKISSILGSYKRLLDPRSIIALMSIFKRLGVYQRQTPTFKFMFIVYQFQIHLHKHWVQQHGQFTL